MVMRKSMAPLALATCLVMASLPAAAAQLGAWGVLLGDQDHGVRPGDDFFRYQNGGWLAQAAPDAQHPFMSYWRDVRTAAPARLIMLLNQLAERPSAGTGAPLGKVALLYREYLDEAAIERRGHAPLEPELAAIRAIGSRAEVAAQMGRMEGPLTLRGGNLLDQFGRGMFTIAIGQDRERTTRNVVYLGQGGLMLPDATYYLHPELADIKTAYRRYVETMLTRIGWPDPAARADEIVQFETQVAQASTPLEALLDPARTYHPVSLAALRSLAPGFDWGAFLGGAGLAPATRIVIDDPQAFARLATLYANADLAMLRARQAFAMADYNAALLSSDLFGAKLAFRTAMLNTPSLAARDRHSGAERLVEAVMPDTIGTLYVSRFSSPMLNVRGTEMAERLRGALDARLQRANWLSPRSRQLARRKLAAMQIKVGYPDHFDDYRDLHLVGDGLYDDVLRAAAYQWRRLVQSLDRPFDRNRWNLTPMYPQYSYDPQANRAEVSLALMQPPFFDPDADDAVNYGALGTIVAQQILSGFGPGTIRYGADGRLSNWLSPTEAEHLAAMGRGLAARYSALEPIPGVHPRGQVLVAEAMADIGALQIALDAYHASLRGRPAPIVDGLTGDQRFFLGRAQSWRARFTDDAIRNQLAQGSNAIPWMRVNGPLPNVDAWYAAFNVQPGDRLYLPPAERIHPF